MRIIGGKYRGRRLATPEGSQIRPTTDRLRESVFNILVNKLEFAHLHVLDVFAGTGALGLEALSRGAGRVTFIEQDREALKLIEHNIQMLNASNVCEIMRLDATRPPVCQGPEADLVFLDPPYSKNFLLPALQGLLERGYCQPTTRLVCEQDKREPGLLVEGFTVEQERIYGSTRFTFLKPTES